MKKKITTKILSILCMIMFMLTSVSTGAFASTVTGARYEPTKAPKIEFFNSSAYNIAPGETVKLSWRVLGAKSVEITGEEKEIECVSEDSLEVWPMVTTEYTLHAYGFNGEEVTKTILVKVGAAEVRQFTATPQEVSPGEAVTLNWDVYNTDNVTISNTADSQYGPQGSVVVNPEKTTTYTLTAVGADGQTVTAEVKVKVKDPEIKAFTATAEEVAPGEAVTLNWDVANVKNVTISNIPDGQYGPQGSVVVNPEKSTTYTLTAVGADGQIVTAEVNVKVKTPVIVSFSADRTEIEQGETAVLSWNVLYAKSVKIIGTEKELESNSGSIEVWPMKTTTYTLIAEGYDGTVVKQDLTVVVTDPLIASFTASKTEITKGEMITLSWTTNNAVSCSIETSTGPKLKNRPLNGSISVTPNKDMTFTLVVVGKDGKEKRKTINITVIKKNAIK